MLGRYIHHSLTPQPAAEAGSAAVARTLEQPERHRKPEAEPHHILRNQRKPAVAAVLDTPADTGVGIAQAEVEIASAPAQVSRIVAEIVRTSQIDPHPVAPAPAQRSWYTGTERFEPVQELALPGCVGVAQADANERLAC